MNINELSCDADSKVFLTNDVNGINFDMKIFK